MIRTDHCKGDKPVWKGRIYVSSIDPGKEGIYSIGSTIEKAAVNTMCLYTRISELHTIKMDNKGCRWYIITKVAYTIQCCLGNVITLS